MVDFAGTDDSNAIFISYTHVDNQPFGPDALRWISYLHEQLTSRLEQLLGQRVPVWRDDKLQGNDVFVETTVEQLSRVSALISVCSPRYLKSEWCQRELNEFLAAAKSGGGLQVGTKSRVFKVVKTPVPLNELRAPLDALLGYEFYEEISGQRRIREFLLNPDPQQRWKFYARVDDLAQDIAALLEDLSGDGHRGSNGAQAGGRCPWPRRSWQPRSTTISLGRSSRFTCWAAGTGLGRRARTGRFPISRWTSPAGWPLATAWRS